MSADRNPNFKLGFSAWSQRLMAVTDDYEEIVLGFKKGREGVITYVGVSGRQIPAQGTSLFALGGHE